MRSIGLESVMKDRNEITVGVDVIVFDGIEQEIDGWLKETAVSMDDRRELRCITGN